jgi:hypothetical protein
VTFPRDGKYEVFITYAAADSWPVRVDLNQQIMHERALAAPTGGWDEPNQTEEPMGVWTVKAGTNEVGFYREHPSRTAASLAIGLDQRYLSVRSGCGFGLRRQRFGRCVLYFPRLISSPSITPMMWL